MFGNNPTVTNENVTISWTFNEAVSTRCTLQTPADISIVPCNDSWTGNSLSEGYHAIYVIGTDLENNVGIQGKHIWNVGKVLLY